jgi:hypothetical protein
MPSEIIEEERLNVSGPEIEFNGLENVDERFAEFYRLVMLLEISLEPAYERHQDGKLTERYLVEIFEAHQAGVRVLQREDIDEWAADFSRLDDEALVELRSTVGYVAPHFGVELKLPRPTSGSNETTHEDSEGGRRI